MAGEKLEKGICIVCGREAAGIPAKPDIVVKAARKIRSFLRNKPHHTIVEKAHLKEAEAKRIEFEKAQKNYLLAAALFLFLVIAGSIAFGNLMLWPVLAGLFGAIFIALLSYAKYYPKF